MRKALRCSKDVAETGAGQHGVATATCAALLGLACTVYMGVKDMDRQALKTDREKSEFLAGEFATAQRPRTGGALALLTARLRFT